MFTVNIEPLKPFDTSKEAELKLRQEIFECLLQFKGRNNNKELKKEVKAEVDKIIRKFWMNR